MIQIEYSGHNAQYGVYKKDLALLYTPHYIEPMNNKELILWANKTGSEDWEADLITTAPDTAEGKAKIEKASAWAKSNGFDRIRLSKNDASVAPDFAKAVRK